MLIFLQASFRHARFEYVRADISIESSSASVATATDTAAADVASIADHQVLRLNITHHFSTHLRNPLGKDFGGVLKNV